MSIVESVVPAPAAGLPASIVQLQFNDLKAANIARTHRQLNHIIEHQGFPEGRWISDNKRTWTLEEVQQWLASRPATRPDTLAIKRHRQRYKLKRQRAASRSEV